MISFNNVIDNDLIKEQLRNSIKNGAVYHAYIIEGEKGIGKMNLALDFSAYLVNDEKRVMSHNHPDVISVTHEKPDTIGVDDVRKQITDTVDIRPYMSEKKIYIVDEAQKLTQQAQNALLKTLEEPPEYVVIMLLCTDEKALLSTISSRCVKLKMKPATDAGIAEYLRKNFEIEEDELNLTVAFASGNPGKAIRIAGSEDFRKLYSETMHICSNIKNMGTYEILAAIRRIRKLPTGTDDFFDLLQLWYRDLMMYKVTKDINTVIFKADRVAIMDLAALSSYEGIERIMEAIEKCRTRLKANVSPELALELMLLTMREN